MKKAALSYSSLVVCQVLMNRYVEVLQSEWRHAPPEFVEMFVEAQKILNQARADMEHELLHQVMMVPTKTDESSLLSLVDKAHCRRAVGVKLWWSTHGK